MIINHPEERTVRTPLPSIKQPGRHAQCHHSPIALYFPVGLTLQMNKCLDYVQWTQKSSFTWNLLTRCLLMTSSQEYVGSNVWEAFKKSEADTNESSVITLSKAQFVRYRIRASSAGVLRGQTQQPLGTHKQAGAGRSGKACGQHLTQQVTDFVFSGPPYTFNNCWGPPEAFMWVLPIFTLLDVKLRKV